MMDSTVGNQSSKRDRIYRDFPPSFFFIELRVMLVFINESTQHELIHEDRVQLFGGDDCDVLIFNVNKLFGL